MVTDLETKLMVISPLIHQFRNPSIFRGEAGEEPNKRLKEYDRVARYNTWDELFCLANVYFFLDGTAQKWFENNEELLTTWDQFKKELAKTFGDSIRTRKRAEEELKSRAQQHCESMQSYTQSVLRLCHEVNPEMQEIEKMSHLIKDIS
ncbi:hypothetical protein AVEN_74975-1 [Araneus ventricosus]|uniref:Retrotransposon gag domain-containing protein n=1 Tax=Araneus ventricosus TaxID=182803 RepID=A0A4Y2G0F9_ARAVE|nr:hypothetical protein AVEN_74975-1 [Araneus ventricosus]